MRVNDKEMSYIQQSIPFQEQNKPDSILVEFRSCNITIGCGSHPFVGCIFQKKQKRIEVGDKDIEGINEIESTPQEPEKTKVKILKKLKLFNKAPKYWKLHLSRCFSHDRLKLAKGTLYSGCTMLEQ